MDVDSDATSPAPSHLPFLDVYAANGLHRRFAAGTKAGFVVNRFNRKLVETVRKYSHVECVKQGEEAVEFGPDAELVTYGQGWKLWAVQDVEVSKPEAVRVSKSEPKENTMAFDKPVQAVGGPNSKAKDGTNAFTEPVQKVFDPADFYPGGKLPDSSRPESYALNIFLLFLFIFSLCGAWVFVLESNFFIFT